MTCRKMGVCAFVNEGQDWENSCGLCHTCVGNGTLSCAPSLPAAASALDCSGHGSCSNGECVCDNTAGHGHWTGARCSRCIEGFSGDSCTQQDTLAFPPQSQTVFSDTAVEALEQTSELRAVQYPVAVNDFSTQVHADNVAALIGPPDALKTYYRYATPLGPSILHTPQIISYRP